MTRRVWTDDELDILRRNYADSRTEDIARALGKKVGAVLRRANYLGLKKSPAFYAAGLGGRLDGVTGNKSRFPKGHKPWNAGLKGVCTGGQATQFKPGRPPQEARNYLPIGSVRLSKDGYLERKVTDDQSIVPARRWVGVHRLLWIELHGPIPDGHAVVFRNGNRMDIRDENLELITRAELSRRNTQTLPKDLREAMKLSTRIRRKLNELAQQ